MTAPVSGPDIADLVDSIVEVVNDTNAAISIRTEDGVYLYVNERWERVTDLSKEEVVNKKLSDISRIPKGEVRRFIAADDIAREKRYLVVLDSFTVQGKEVRTLSVRASLRYTDTRYIVEVSFILGPVVTKPQLN